METSGDMPSPQVGVAMAAVDGVIYVFVGRDKEHEELNELYSLDTTRGTLHYGRRSRGRYFPPIILQGIKSSATRPFTLRPKSKGRRSLK